jgi:hypothetical protein
MPFPVVLFLIETLLVPDELKFISPKSNILLELSITNALDADATPGVIDDKYPNPLKSNDEPFNKYPVELIVPVRDPPESCKYLESPCPIVNVPESLLKKAGLNTPLMIDGGLLSNPLIFYI